MFNEKYISKMLVISTLVLSLGYPCLASSANACKLSTHHACCSSEADSLNKCFGGVTNSTLRKVPTLAHFLYGYLCLGYDSG
eukprot:m.56572 g.56572  ORF g.56572 m.56572 type:complete len:82 (+) comp11045_c0_seq2:247-492(+)